MNYRQRFEEAEAVLANRSPTDPVLIVEIASIRGQNLAFGLRRVDDAREVFASEARKVQNSDLRARLETNAPMVSAVRGDFGDATTVSRSVLDDPGASEVPKAAAFVTLTVALAMTGDCDGMDSLIDEAKEVTETARQVLPFARDQIEIMDVLSMINAGRFEGALEACRSAMEVRGPHLRSFRRSSPHNCWPSQSEACSEPRRRR